jgi:hypothetical protein
MLRLVADFGASGKLGPIRLEMAPRHGRDWLGDPWLEGPHKRSLIWNYGALEVTFQRGEIFEWEIGLIRISYDRDDLRLPDRFPPLVPVSLFDFCAELSASGVAVETTKPAEPGEVRLRIPRNGVSAIFSPRLRWIGIGPIDG